MRADRLVALVLLLQARGRMTAQALAAELEVSVRTVYRDLEALGAAGVPVRTESGPGGGCQLVEGYRFPLRGLRPDEAEALLILGVPGVLRELGLDAAATAAHRQIRMTAGLPAPGESDSALVHLDLPRWFRAQEPAPHLRTLAEALRQARCLAIDYRRAGDGQEPARRREVAGGGQRPARSREVAGEGHAPARSREVADEGHPPIRRREVAPLGLVDKAGTWYLVASARGRAGSDRPATVFRVSRITAARVLTSPAPRPPGFSLAAFWARWSEEFMSTRPSVPVRLRASPHALAAFTEVFGDGAQDAIAAALPPDTQGWRELTLRFEHELAAAHRLAGFGGQVEVLAPSSVRTRLQSVAEAILARYHHRPEPTGGMDVPEGGL
ncbi:MAG TPA: WYL domain-containing protein [Streptosporangiaceae bacterium]